MNNQDKSLKDKAIDIQGKQYVLVSDRVIFFNEKYPNGSIQTQLVDGFEDKVCIKAIVTPDVEKPTRVFTGYSQAAWGQGFVNKTAALENAETSAVGRALAMMSIGVLDSIASVDEIHKAKEADWIEDGDYESMKDLCPIHKVELRTFSKNGKTWKSHKNQDGTWCNGGAK